MQTRHGALTILAALTLLGTHIAPLPSQAAPGRHVAVSNEAASPLSARQRALHLLNRFAFGPRPGDVEQVMRVGPDHWFHDQLFPEQLDDSAVEQRLSLLRTLHMPPTELAQAYPNPGQVKKAEAQGIVMDATGTPRDILVELSDQKLVRAVESNRQLQEVMADFWENHFNVSFQKGLDHWLITDYDQNVLRPHALGRFRDLLGAVAHSPAMLVYLDNWLSTRNPGPGDARRKLAGLNENYARELMELHTLGVDGGYTQQDVIEVARCFTGWSIQRPRRAAGDQDIFVFHADRHDDGQKVVLGVVIPPGGGESDGEKVLDILARNPHTAHHLALKLCQRFVSDNPPDSIVRKVATTYMQTDGDIKMMLLSIYQSPEFWSRAAYRSKIKTPFDMVVSAMRAVNAHLMDGKALTYQMNKMGEGMYLCEPPTGYKDTADAWVSSGALIQRLNFSLALAQARVPGVQVDLGPLLNPVRGLDPQGEGSPHSLDALVSSLLQEDISDTTRKSLLDAMQHDHVNYENLVGLILGSPEFQRH